MADGVGMVEMVTIKRLSGNEWHGNVLDVAADMKDVCGSPANAIVNMVRGSPTFKEKWAKIKAKKKTGAECRPKKSRANG